MTTPHQQPTAEVLDVAALISKAAELINQGLVSRIREPATGWRVRAQEWKDLYDQHQWHYHGLLGAAQSRSPVAPPIEEVHL